MLFILFFFSSKEALSIKFSCNLSENLVFENFLGQKEKNKLQQKMLGTIQKPYTF